VARGIAARIGAREPVSAACAVDVVVVAAPA